MERINNIKSELNNARNLCSKIMYDERLSNKERMNALSKQIEISVILFKLETESEVYLQNLAKVASENT